MKLKQIFSNIKEGREALDEVAGGWILNKNARDGAPTLSFNNGDVFVYRNDPSKQQYTEFERGDDFDESTVQWAIVDAVSGVIVKSTALAKNATNMAGEVAGKAVPDRLVVQFLDLANDQLDTEMNRNAPAYDPDEDDEQEDPISFDEMKSDLKRELYRLGYVVTHEEDEVILIQLEKLQADEDPAVQIENNDEESKSCDVTYYDSDVASPTKRKTFPLVEMIHQDILDYAEDLMWEHKEAINEPEGNEPS